MLTTFILAFFGVTFLAVLYLMPTLVAFHRKHHQRLAILVLNVFGGFTGIFWVAALIWAASAVEPADQK